MRLDRPTVQSSPPNASLPAARRTGNGLNPHTLQRPGIPSRGSTASLASNDSSLLGSSRRIGSGLKQFITVQDDGAPLSILLELLGLDTKEPTAPIPDCITDDDLSLSFDFDGLGLRQSASLDDGRLPTSPKGRLRGNDARDKVKLDDLHTAITAFDEVLESIETNLSTFRSDLAAVSAEIESLQARSVQLNVRLENRLAVETALSPVVEELSVSPTVVARILDGPIDDSWVKSLGDIDRQLMAYRANLSTSRQSKAWSDLGPLLENLILKAVERVRDYLVAQVKGLRSPHINAQIIQQQSFINFKDLFAFLHKHHGRLADEICQAYLNTMRWYYANQFSRYGKALETLKLHLFDKTDVLASEEGAWKTTTGKTQGPSHDAFNLGRRIDILQSTDRAAMPAYQAEDDQATHYMEVPFRNFNLALVDNAAAEYSFLASFFAPPYSLAVVSKNFHFIFEPVFACGQSLTRSLIGETYDVLGLLLCVRLNQQLAFDLQRQKVPAVDGYVNATNLLLWPRLQVVMGRHCECIRHASQALPQRPIGKSSVELARLSSAPHVLTQRFGQLVHGILSLSVESGDDEPILASVRRLRIEMETFLQKYCQTHYPDRRKGNRFLYNNYSLLHTILSDVRGKLATREQEHFDERKDEFKE